MQTHFRLTLIPQNDQQHMSFVNGFYVAISREHRRLLDGRVIAPHVYHTDVQMSQATPAHTFVLLSSNTPNQVAPKWSISISRES
jgi:hypothetical protein